MSDIKFLDLTADNIFDLCSVLDAVGLESVMNIFNNDEIRVLQKSGEDAKSIGIVIAMKVIDVIVKNLSTARESIYTFFSGCCVRDNDTPVSVDELRTMKVSDFLKLMKAFFSKGNMEHYIEEIATVFEIASTEEPVAMPE